MKENDEAMSIMLNYHWQRQKRTMLSFKNKTSNAWVAYQEGTVSYLLSRVERKRVSRAIDLKRAFMNSVYQEPASHILFDSSLPS